MVGVVLSGTQVEVRGHLYDVEGEEREEGGRLHMVEVSGVGSLQVRGVRVSGFRGVRH